MRQNKICLRGFSRNLKAATAPEETEKRLEEATRRVAELESQLEVERAERAKLREQNHQLVRQYQDRVDVLGQMSERCAKQEAEVKKAKEKSAILKAVNGTTVEDFYNNRAMIQSRMEASVKARFATEQVGDFVEIPPQHFQLLFVQIDGSKQAAIVNTEVLRERQREKLKENEVNFISGQQEVVLGEAARVVNQTMSSAASNATVVRNNATAEAERVRLEVEQRVYSAAKLKLNLTNSELLRFLWIKHLNTTGGQSTMKVGFEQQVMRTLRMDHAGQ